MKSRGVVVRRRSRRGVAVLVTVLLSVVAASIALVIARQTVLESRNVTSQRDSAAVLRAAESALADLEATLQVSPSVFMTEVLEGERPRTCLTGVNTDEVYGPTDAWPELCGSVWAYDTPSGLDTRFEITPPTAIDPTLNVRVLSRSGGVDAGYDVRYVADGANRWVFATTGDLDAPSPAGAEPVGVSGGVYAEGDLTVGADDVVLSGGGSTYFGTDGESPQELTASGSDWFGDPADGVRDIRGIQMSPLTQDSLAAEAARLSSVACRLAGNPENVMAAPYDSFSPDVCLTAGSAAPAGTTSYMVVPDSPTPGQMQVYTSETELDLSADSPLLCSPQPGCSLAEPGIDPDGNSDDFPITASFTAEAVTAPVTSRTRLFAWDSPVEISGSGVFNISADQNSIEVNEPGLYQVHAHLTYNTTSPPSTDRYSYLHARLKVDGVNLSESTTHHSGNWSTINLSGAFVSDGSSTVEMYHGDYARRNETVQGNSSVRRSSIYLTKLGDTDSVPAGPAMLIQSGSYEYAPNGTGYGTSIDFPKTFAGTPQVTAIVQENTPGSLAGYYVKANNLSDSAVRFRHYRTDGFWAAEPATVHWIAVGTAADPADNNIGVSVPAGPAMMIQSGSYEYAPNGTGYGTSIDFPKTFAGTPQVTATVQENTPGSLAGYYVKANNLSDSAVRFRHYRTDGFWAAEPATVHWIAVGPAAAPADNNIGVSAECTSEEKMIQSGSYEYAPNGTGYGTSIDFPKTFAGTPQVTAIVQENTPGSLAGYYVKANNLSDSAVRFRHYRTDGFWAAEPATVHWIAVGTAADPADNNLGVSAECTDDSAEHDHDDYTSVDHNHDTPASFTAEAVTAPVPSGFGPVAWDSPVEISGSGVFNVSADTNSIEVNEPGVYQVNAHLQYNTPNPPPTAAAYVHARLSADGVNLAESITHHSGNLSTINLSGVFVSDGSTPVTIVHADVARRNEAVQGRSSVRSSSIYLTKLGGTGNAPTLNSHTHAAPNVFTAEAVTAPLPSGFGPVGWDSPVEISGSGVFNVSADTNSIEVNEPGLYQVNAHLTYNTTSPPPTAAAYVHARLSADGVNLAESITHHSGNWSTINLSGVFVSDGSTPVTIVHADVARRNETVQGNSSLRRSSIYLTKIEPVTPIQLGPPAGWDFNTHPGELGFWTSSTTGSRLLGTFQMPVSGVAGFDGDVIVGYCSTEAHEYAQSNECAAVNGTAPGIQLTTPLTILAGTPEDPHSVVVGTSLYTADTVSGAPPLVALVGTDKAVIPYFARPGAKDMTIDAFLFGAGLLAPTESSVVGFPEALPLTGPADLDAASKITITGGITGRNLEFGIAGTEKLVLQSQPYTISGSAPHFSGGAPGWDRLETKRITGDSVCQSRTCDNW